jgi:hypothetical protein
MKRTRHTPEQVINKLREADAMLSSGRSMAKVLQWCAAQFPDTPFRVWARCPLDLCAFPLQACVHPW